jgi:hypothetical protein
VRPVMPIATVGVIAAVITATATACGSAAPAGTHGPSPSRTSATRNPLAGLTSDQIVQKAVKDLTDAKSVRISGTLPTKDGSVAVNVSDVAPASCQGTIGFPLKEFVPSATGTAPAAVIVTGGIAYLKPSNAFLREVHDSPPVVAELRGKYIETKNESELADVADLCSLPKFAGLFAHDDDGFIMTGTTTIDGQPALGFSQPGTTPAGTVYISESATPHLLELNAASTGETFHLTFGDFNVPVAIAAPPAADIVHGATAVD